MQIKTFVSAAQAPTAASADEPTKDEYLITDPPLKALTVFAMPIILGSFFQQVYNMADSIIVGQFVGSSALELFLYKFY